MYYHENKDLSNLHVGMHCFHENRESPSLPKGILEQSCKIHYWESEYQCYLSTTVYTRSLVAFLESGTK